MQWVSAAIAGLLVLFIGGFGLTAIGMSIWDDIKRRRRDRAVQAAAARALWAEKKMLARKRQLDANKD